MTDSHKERRAPGPRTHDDRNPERGTALGANSCAASDRTDRTLRIGGRGNAEISGQSVDPDDCTRARRRLHEQESIDDLLTQLRLAHARLMRAARNAPDLDRGCFQRANGELMSGRQRLALLAKHWAEHVHELNDAAK